MPRASIKDGKKVKVDAVYNDYSSAGRALNTDYHNTTGHPLLVQVTVWCDVDTATEQANAQCKIGTASPANITVGIVGIFAATVAIGDFYFVATFVVPADYWYAVDTNTDVGCTVTMTNWIETELRGQ